MLLKSLVALAVCLSANALVIHERRAVAPNGFNRIGNAPADNMITLRLNLASNDLEGLEEKLMLAATPGSPSFRQWLSKEEVESHAAPTASTVSAVKAWLSSNKIDESAITTVTPAGDWISIRVPISHANTLLSTTFGSYTQPGSSTPITRTLSYSLPDQIAPLIKTIHPTNSFTRGLRQGPQVLGSIPHTDVTVPSSCNKTITPACLQALYQIPTTAATNKQNLLGVAGFGDQFANKADLKTFLQDFRTDMSSSTSFSLTSVDGGQNTQSSGSAGVEANLDIQYTVGLATGVPTTFVSVGDNTQDGDDGGFLDIINALLGESAPPQVLTTSYGFNKEGDLSFSLTNSLCNSYMQLTSRGVSILFASGDGGVAATPGESCSTQFNPTFPTCPFVTLVGATENVNPEKGAELSAGGFSNYFAQPSYQASTVSAYLTKLGSTDSGKFNRSGRAFPDVAAQGQRVEIVVSGRTTTVAGTSCSSPIFSSTIALINNDLLNAGKAVLGFLNPWMYANPQAFNDITTGNNPGCGTNGFPALSGWDPVTGLGTPNYPAMRTAAGL